MKWFAFFVLLFVGISFLGHSTSLFAQQLNSSNYQIDNYSIGSLDTSSASSTNYEITYDNDVTITYDAPSSGTSGGGGGGRIIVLTSATTSTSTATINQQASTTNVVPLSIPSTPYTPPLSPSQVFQQEPQNKEPQSFDGDINTENGDVIRLPYYASSTRAPKSLRGVFSDGTVAMITIFPDTFPVGTDITFIITKILFSKNLTPYNRTTTLVDQFLYRIDAVDMNENQVSSFGDFVRFTILYPDKSISSDTTVYKYVVDERLWQILSRYTVGRNLVSFDILQPTLVSFWGTNGNPETLPLDLPQIETDESTEIASTSETVTIFSTVPVVWILGGGVVLLILLILYVVWLLLRRRNYNRNY